MNLASKHWRPNIKYSKLFGFIDKLASFGLGLSAWPGEVLSI